MTAVQKYILDEAKAIEKGCSEKGITANEWVERYAKNYHSKYWNNNQERTGPANKNHRNKSRWAAWLERVNNT